MNRRHQTLADYAAIGLAPLLIFGMLTSLAGFLMLVLYQGNYSQRVTWTLMCYTMGVTALARVTIEESRSHSSIYAVALGTATFFVLVRFLGDPIFSAAIILTIGYLADRIVHDCTIVDDGIDSSGQGLVDSARRWIERQAARRPASARADQLHVDTNRAQGKQGHQPGRTVLYLAFGALPLFGIGQFFLRGNPGSWERARWMLTLYLFTSLSLLVVTSFLNLRRYLRQRSTEMPAHVTASWLLGGVAMILVILLFAFIAPLPGQAILSFELPKFLTHTGPTVASRFGWGDEGADSQGESASPTATPRPDAETPSGAPETPVASQPGSPAGGDSGDRDESSAGKDSSGKESGGSQTSQKSNDESKGKQPGRSSPQSENVGEEGDVSKSDMQSSQSPQGNDRDESRDTSAAGDDAQPSKQKPRDTAEQSDAESQDAEASEIATPADQSSERPAATEPDSAESNSAAPPPPDAQSKSPADWSGMLAGFAGLLKFLVIAALLLFVALYVYLNRQALLAWYYRLFGAGQETGEVGPSRESRRETSAPDRPFSSFANPVGAADPVQVVVVTFQALEAWGREQGVPRSNDETPAEYAQRLVIQFPNLTRATFRVVDAYNRVVYGRGNASAADVTAASSVWQVMRPQL